MDAPRPPAQRSWLILAVVVVVVTVLVVLSATWDSKPGTGRDFDLRNGRAFIQDNLWTDGDQQYAVWVDENAQPMLGIRTDDAPWSVTDLSAIDGNPLAAPTDDDQHNVYAVAVDPLGYIHISGNMHGDELRYIRSAQPGATDDWVRPEMGGPNERVTYPAFVKTPDGTLLFFRREGRSGLANTYLDILPSGAERWEHVGMLVNGTATDESVYLSHVAVDPDTGMVHVGFLWRQGRSTVRNNDVGYMRSPDGGRSWEKTTGETIELPLRHPGSEIAFPAPPRGDRLINHGGMVVDDEGRPHMVFSGRDRLQHIWHDGEQWHAARPLLPFKGSRPSLARGTDGSVWAIGTRGVALSAEQIHPTVGPTVDGPTVAFGWEPVIDTEAMQAHDRVQFLLVPPGDEPEVGSMELPG